MIEAVFSDLQAARSVPQQSSFQPTWYLPYHFANYGFDHFLLARSHPDRRVAVWKIILLLFLQFVLTGLQAVFDIVQLRLKLYEMKFFTAFKVRALAATVVQDSLKFTRNFKDIFTVETVYSWELLTALIMLKDRFGIK